jgi:hypothetical protein
MAGLNELDLSVGAIQPSEHAIDPISGLSSPPQQRKNGPHRPRKYNSTSASAFWGLSKE